jgi:hypothetical protein
MSLEDVIKEAEDLALLATKELKGNYSGAEATDKTKRSMGLLAIYKGLIQASNNRYGLQYRIVKDLSENPDELKKIIRSSLPHINPVKMIDGKKK